MKENEMIQSPKFEVNLGGVDLSEKQAQELEKAIQQTTLQFLAKLDNGHAGDILAYKPNPDDDGTGPVVGPFPGVGPFRRPKWWFGWIVWKQPKVGQFVQLDRLRASIPDFAMNGTFEKPQIRF
ncbi:hypothetical protein GCM10028805_18160 [Spirosoma harenae]